MSTRAERERRIGLLLPVEFERLGKRTTGMAGNISRGGIYVRTEELVPPGEIVELGIALPRGFTVRVMSRAIHTLEPEAAHALGRYAGIGFRFLDEDTPALRAIAEMIDDVAGEVCAAAGSEGGQQVRIVVADGDERLLDRKATVLGDAGYVVEAVANGVEAFSACLERSPEIVLAAEDMPIMDGPTLAQQIAQDKLDVSVVFVKMPFTDEDLCAQVATALAQRRSRPSLRASLREMSLGALLSFLDSSKKTGTVSAVRGDVLIELRVREGRIVNVIPSGGKEPRERLLDLLDWTDGVFEFHAGAVDDEDQVQWSTTRLLLEHARTRDELMEATTAVRNLASLEV
jgi:CheY-like chemotaxis protein